jgi:peptide/nickel transport system permease protein
MMKSSASGFWNMARVFLAAPTGRAAVVAVLLLGLLSILGPMVWGDQARRMRILDAGLGPSAQHLLGTDRLGRDILARLLAATRLSVGLGLAAGAIAAAVGIPFGGLVSLLGPRLRAVGLRLIDVLLAFPPILVAIFVTAIIGPGPQGAVAGIGIAFAPEFARVTTALAASVSGRDYIANARVIGVPPARLLLRYILPNIAETLVISIFVVAGVGLVWVSSLSFLGLGVQPPEYDWGRMLTDGVQDLYSTPLSALAPALMIAATGLALGFVGEALAHAMNPLLWARSRGVRATGLDISAPSISNNGNGTVPTESLSPATVAHTVQVKQPLLHVEGLTVSFSTSRGNITPVAGLSFDVAEGEMVGIVGESGSGKSLTALAIAQLVPYPGRVRADSLRLHGEELLCMPAHRSQRFLGTELAMIFQDPMSSLNPALKIEAQLTEAAEVHRRLNHVQALEQALVRMRDVHIPAPEARLGQYPHEFSGGMRQRTMIAMGLMTHPSLIIADEPTTALDVTIQAQIIDVLREVNRQYGTAVLLISHDIGVVSDVCSRVLVMYAGRIVEDISTERLVREPTHPYTRALMAAVPDMTAERNRPLAAIPGSPPELEALPPGCPFAPRCPEATESCWTQEPRLEQAAEGHRIACWVEGEQLRQRRQRA